MHYAGVDVLSIAPSNFQKDAQESVTSEDKAYCAICKDELNVQDAKVVPHSKSDVVMLPCKHPYHYACLREACRHNKFNKAGRECALCRAPYPAYQQPLDDDGYVPAFHTKAQTCVSGLHPVDWENVKTGSKLYVSPKASKFKRETVEFLSQTKCQARVRVLSLDTIARLGKSNLWQPQ